AELDTLRLWGYYSIDSQATWHLMTLVEGLSEILPGQYPSTATWRSFDDVGYARYDTVYVELNAADHDTTGPAPADAIVHFANYVGDYSGDASIGFSDFATLTSAWTDQNTYHDIGPATGTPPDLMPTPDGEIDFEDLAVFSIMWNALADGSGAMALLNDEQTVGYVRPGSGASAGTADEHPVVVQPAEPDDVWKQDDGLVTWNIEAREVSGLSAAHLVMRYDPAQLHFLEFEPGTFLGSVNGREQSLIQLKRIDPQAGILELMLGRIDGVDPDVDGSGILATIRFREMVTAEHSFTIAYDLRDRSTGILAAGRYEAEVASTRLPGEFALLQNYPNPFNGQTTIRFQLPSRQKVSLHIFNVRGQLVRTLLDEEMEGGYHKVAWDGRTESGRTAASGIYIYLIQAGRDKQSRKLTIIK
ncbi:FlgD immunoglobulin-like domain containing protein, partial [Gemmatimonadota bacterium]